MKKVLFVFIALAIVVCFPQGVKHANADTNVPTNIVLPSSYLEYLELSAPLDVWTDGTEYVFCELDRIIYFDGANYKYFELPSYSVSEIHKLENNIIFLSGSKIYKLNITTSEVTLCQNIDIADSFAISGDTLVTNPSNELKFYSITDPSEFIVDEISTLKKNFTYIPSNICLSSDNSTIYYSYGNAIYKVDKSASQGEIIATNIEEPRSITFGGGYVFVSYKDGLKKLNSGGGEVAFLPISGERTLDNLHYPQGCFYNDGNIFIADESLNCIFKFTENLEKTHFHITTNHNGFNRISPEVKAITSTDSAVYILDNNTIKVLDQKTKKISELSTSSYGGLRFISASKDTILVSSGTNLVFFKVAKDKLEEVKINSPLNRFENVSAIATFENDYYVLNNETVNNQQKAVVYKFNSSTATLSQHTSYIGRGDALACDIFGDIYTAVYSQSDGNYSIYATDISASKNKKITSLTQPILQISVDYEGNLFSLLDNNVVVKTFADTSENYNIEVSSNLPANSSAIDFTVCSETETAYFLYKGFVLEASSVLLGVQTPQKIPVPDNFDIALDTEPQFLTLKSGAKLFEVNLSNAPNLGQYFDYKAMRANTDVNLEYVCIATTGRYSLIANNSFCAIVRTEDTLEKIIATSEAGNAYAVNDCNVYSYPIIKNFTKYLPAQKNQYFDIVHTFMFNDIEFALVSWDNNFGYVASSMLKQGTASNLTAKEIKAVTTNKKTSLYFSEDLSGECVSLDKGSIVLVLANDAEVGQIIYDGKVYFIDSDALELKSPKVKRNIAVVALLFTALFISGIYLAGRILNHKKDKKALE